MGANLRSSTSKYPIPNLRLRLQRRPLRRGTGRTLCQLNPLLPLQLDIHAKPVSISHVSFTYTPWSVSK